MPEGLADASHCLGESSLLSPNTSGKRPIWTEAGSIGNLTFQAVLFSGTRELRAIVVEHAVTFLLAKAEAFRLEEEDSAASANPRSRSGN